tara:strand:+ start:1941 stop:3185 length:1245 start_codon:yes stop_codon:yes gene_type:complete
MKSHYFYLICLLIIPLLPSQYSLDVIGVHWFAFAIINISFLIYLFYIKQDFSFKSFLDFKPYFFLLLFILFCAFSLFYSNNIELSIVDLSRVLTTFLSIVIFSSLIKTRVNLFILSLIVSFFLIFDVLFAIKPYVIFAYQKGASFIDVLSSNYDPSILKGLTGNKNINAAFILIKVPFLFYVISSLKNKFISVLTYLFLFTVLCLLFLLKARAAYLSLFFISLIFMLYSFFYSKKDLFYIPVLIVSFFCSSLIINSSKSTSLSSEISSIDFSNESSSSRFLLWKNALNSSYENNFIGLGLGNWKIESLPYWNKNGSAYIVPYHAHNDFFELLAEIGILGVLSYMFIFFFSFFFIIKGFLKSKDIFYLIVGSSLFVYFVDANLNFPIERAVMQIFFAFLLFLIHNKYADKSVNHK